MTRDEFVTELSKATRRVHSMDRVDGYRERSLPTILSAMEAGIRNPDSSCQFDAYVMLRELWWKEREPHLKDCKS